MQIADYVLVKLTSAISNTDTSIVLNAPENPYKAPPDPAGTSLSSLTLTDSLTAPTKVETIKYSDRTGTGPYTLTGVIRGTPAYSWEAGTKVFQAVSSDHILHEGLEQKTTLLNNDLMGVLDSGNLNQQKKITWADAKASLKNYFDTLYNNADNSGYRVEIESTNGTEFRVGLGYETLLVAHVYLNGIEVTSSLPGASFRWRRKTLNPKAFPNDDETWNAQYVSGYKQINVSVDNVDSKATFFCDILII